MASDVGVVIPAAGKGERLGSRASKAFVRLAGEPLVLHALRAFQASPAVGWIVVAARVEDRARLQALVRAHRLTKVCDVVAGGASRSASVARGVAALPAQATWVVVHDAARPCLGPRFIESIITQAKRYGAIACGIPASVTVKAVDVNQRVRMTLDREGLSFIQTPQAFRRDWWVEAMSRVDHQLDGMPDDVALLEWAGYPVRIVSGDPLNIKVTTKDDLVLADTIMQQRFGSPIDSRHLPLRRVRL